jgi:hypothetical protein
MMWNRSTAVSGLPAARRGAVDSKIMILMLCAAVALALAAPGIKSGCSTAKRLLLAAENIL